MTRKSSAFRNDARKRGQMLAGRVFGPVVLYLAFIALSDARVGRFEWSVRGESLPVSAWGTATPRKTSLRI